MKLVGEDRCALYILQEVLELGRLPKAFKNPKTETEVAERKLAKRVQWKKLGERAQPPKHLCHHRPRHALATGSKARTPSTPMAFKTSLFRAVSNSSPEFTTSTFDILWHALRATSFMPPIVGLLLTCDRIFVCRANDGGALLVCRQAIEFRAIDSDPNEHRGCTDHSVGCE